MSLKAIVNGKMMRAPFIDSDEWKAIQAKKPRVRMICCNAKGYMRVRENRQEFVHYRRSEDCIGRPDSPEHDYLKTVVMHAAEQAGWKADVEVLDPNRKWIADVLAVKKKAQLAFEIQLSPITHDELRRRYNLYMQSKIRSCWFVKGKVGREYIVEPSGGMPIFSLVENDQAEMGQPRFHVSITPKDHLPIKDAVCSLLNREFKWCHARRVRTVENIVLLRLNNCWFCRKPFGLYKIEGREIRCDEPPRSTYPHDHRLLEPAILEVVELYMTAHPELDICISYPQRVRDSSTGSEDIGFMCSHCRQLIGVHRHYWYWSHNTEPIATIPLEPHARLFEEPHWCQSKEQDFCC